MSIKKKVADTTQKKPTAQAAFLCRDWHTGVVKVLVVKNANDIQKVSCILQNINDLFHYNYDFKSDGKHFEFIRDLKIQELFNQLNEIECDFEDTGCCDVFNKNKVSFIDAYWNF